MDSIDQIFDPASTSFWNLLVAVAVVGVSVFLGRVVRRRTRAMIESTGVDESATALLARVAGWFVVLIGAVLALSIMGVDMVPVVLMIVLFLALVFFSGRTLLENWAAGLLLQARGPYKLGDRIDSESYSGFVEETNTRSVILRTGDGQIVHLPNIGVLTNPLVNRTGEHGRRRSSLTFGVASDSVMDDVERILVDAASSTEGVSMNPQPPTAWIASVGETTVNVELRFWHAYADRHVVRSAVSHCVLDAFNSARILMPYPTREVIVSSSADSQTGSRCHS